MKDALSAFKAMRKKASPRDHARGERIAHARKLAGFTQEQFAELFAEKVTRGAVGNWELGGGVALENLQCIAEYTGASYQWLLMGDGRAPVGRRPIVPSYDPDAPEAPLDPDAAPDASAFPPDGIRELANKGGMGGGQTIQTSYKRDGEDIVQQDAVLDEYWRIPPPYARNVLGVRIADLLVIECQGDSMSPTLAAGERVIVNTAHRQPSPSGLYAIRDQLNEVVVKRIEMFGTSPPRVRIISDNRAHMPEERGLDEIEIVGKVEIGMKRF